MKILIVMNYNVNGGLTGAVSELAASLKKEGFLVNIASTSGKIRERIRNIINIVKVARKYDFIIASGCADYGFLPIMVGVFAGRIHQKKIIVDFHSGYPLPFIKRFGKLIKIFINNIPVTVASEYLFNILQEYKLNVFLISYHFHYENFPKREIEFKWNKKIIWASSFQFMYDPETALKACKLVLQERNDVEFHFFGTGPLLEVFKKRYEQINIIFKGFIPRHELLKKYQDYCIFLNPSFGDNFALRLVEAAFYELLIISARYGGTATIYNDKECLFFKKGDYKELSQHILSVLNNTNQYDSFRKNMNKKVLNFSWTNVKNKWLELLTNK